MTWRQLLMKNSLHNTSRYAGSWLSSSTAVMVYFLFASFVYNPSVLQGNVPDIASAVLELCRFILLLFSASFVSFFHSSMMRGRMNEFGLLSVLGMTPAQIRRFVFGESVFLGGASLVSGILAGLLFLKLFLLVIAAVLKLPGIPFAVPPKAVWDTLILFGLVFLVEGVWMAWRIGRQTVRKLLLARRMPQKRVYPVSPWWVLLAIALLCGAYALAFLSNETNFLASMLPILGMVTIGTHLLYRQGFAFLIQRYRTVSPSGLVRLLLARLAYRIGDHARTLTVVTLLSAIVLTGMGSAFSLQQIAERNSLRLCPFSIQLLVHDGAPPSITANDIRTVLAREQLRIIKQVELPFLAGTLRGTSANREIHLPVMVIPQSTFERVRGMIGETHPSLTPDLPVWTAPEEGQAHFLYPYPYIAPDLFPNREAFLSLGDMEIPVTVTEQRDTRLFNEQDRMDAVVVVTDRMFAAWLAKAPLQARWHLVGFMLADWKDSQRAVHGLVGQMPAQERWLFTDTITQYTSSMRLSSITLFSGFFVSLVFFVACISALYFHLTLQREEDVRQLASLRRIGLGTKEALRVLTAEILILFLVPFLVAALHSTAALLELSHLIPLGKEGYHAFGATVGFYFISLVLACLAIRVQYARSVLAAAHW
ncbi:MAG: ABC transporter permease, partial [Alicyclobacillaceae bacterium]|nr:ABC transporter permease [Alicyclobacillaceae bacterium]